MEIVKFLLEKGANIRAETNTGDTALTYACANGHTVIADILLNCGAVLVSNRDMLCRVGVSSSTIHVHVNVYFSVFHKM